MKKDYEINMEFDELVLLRAHLIRTIQHMKIELNTEKKQKGSTKFVIASSLADKLAPLKEATKIQLTEKEWRALKGFMSPLVEYLKLITIPTYEQKIKAYPDQAEHFQRYLDAAVSMSNRLTKKGDFK